MINLPEYTTLKSSFIPGALIGLILIHSFALTAPFTFTWAGFYFFCSMVIITGMLGITLGYHRLLTHQSFETPRFMKILLAMLGCLSMQGGPLRWVATHRLHHKEADTPSDPHSPIYGFMWSHILWNVYRHPQLNTTEDLKHFAPDIYRDPMLRALDRYFILFNIAFALLVFVIGYIIEGWQLGLSLVIWGCALRIVYVWHITWLVNSATHIWGYQTFGTPNNSRNTWWVALLTFGEGWHNNHHANPQSARMGLTWKEIDVTYWTIQLLSKVGLATKIINRQPALRLVSNSRPSRSLWRATRRRRRRHAFMP